MALYLRQIANRFPANHLISINGRRLINSMAVADRQLDQMSFNSSIKTVSNQLNRDQNLTQGLQFKSACNVKYSQTSSGSEPSNDGASDDKLTEIFENLKSHVPQFFVAPLDYSICHKDIVLEDRIRGKTYNGIINYVKQLSFLRLYGHFKYAYVKMDVLKITKHSEDSSIKIRWRITGITGYRILYKMVQFRVWQPKQMIEKHQKTWIDGFSTLYINNDGLIVRHIVDKVVPDQDKNPNAIDKAVEQLTQVPKLALIVELSTDLTPVIT